MDDSTKAAFDVFLSGILPFGYSMLFEPLLSANVKTNVDDIFVFYITSLIPLLYVSNKNEYTGKYLIPFIICFIFEYLAYWIFRLIIKEIKKKRELEYGTPQHRGFVLFWLAYAAIYQFSPFFYLETNNIIDVLRRVPTHPIVIFGFVLLFLGLLISAYYLYHLPEKIKKGEKTHVFSYIALAIFLIIIFASSILYLIIIPANEIYVKVAFNVDLLMLFRFPGIVKENPYKDDKNENKSNTGPDKTIPEEKMRGIVSIILFGFKNPDKNKNKNALDHSFRHRDDFS